MEIEILIKDEQNIKVIEEPKKQYNKNNKKHFETFYKKNIDKIKEKMTCSVCCGSYTYFNKSVHIRTKRHLKMLESLQNNKKVLDI